MKTLFLSLILFLSSMAHASCPDLSGIYRCENMAVKGGVLTSEFTQETKEDRTTFYSEDITGENPKTVWATTNSEPRKLLYPFARLAMSYECRDNILVQTDSYVYRHRQEEETSSIITTLVKKHIYLKPAANGLNDFVVEVVEGITTLMDGTIIPKIVDTRHISTEIYTCKGVPPN
jgi:hypothetical protein